MLGAGALPSLQPRYYGRHASCARLAGEPGGLIDSGRFSTLGGAGHHPHGGRSHTGTAVQTVNYTPTGTNGGTVALPTITSSVNITDGEKLTVNGSRPAPPPGGVSSKWFIRAD